MKPGKTIDDQPKAKATVVVAASVIGMISSSLTILLGIWHIVNLKPELTISSNDFTEDVNLKWRRVFSLSPSLSGPACGPLIVAIMGTMTHFRRFRLNFMTKNFFNYGVYLFFQAMFINLGYLGGLGIMIGSFSLLAAAFAFGAFSFDDGIASLNLKVPYFEKSKIYGTGKHPEDGLTIDTEKI